MFFFYQRWHQCYYKSVHTDLYMYECFACVYLCVLHRCSLHESQRGCQVPWNWNEGQLWAWGYWELSPVPLQEQQMLLELSPLSSPWGLGLVGYLHLNSITFRKSDYRSKTWLYFVVYPMFLFTTYNMSQ